MTGAAREREGGQVINRHKYTVWCRPEAMDKHTPVPVQDISDFTLKQPTIMVLGRDGCLSHPLSLSHSTLFSLLCFPPFILGNEGYGVRKELSRSCTALLTIPPLRALPPGFDSLNVSVAAGIVLHRLQTSYESCQ